MNTMENPKPTPQEEKVSAMLQAVESKRPTLSRVLKRYGDQPLGQYAETFAVNEAEPIQPRKEVADIAAEYTQRLLGSNLAQKVHQRLLEKPVLLTANHHGPDFLHITLQSDIIFALGESPNSVVPIFAGGIVPLNNLSYGRGIMLSRKQQNPDNPSKTVPVKVTIFPKDEGERMVSVTPTFTLKQVNDAFSEVDALDRKGIIGSAEKRILRWVLKQDYRDPSVLNQSSYSDQSVILNNRLWKRYFATDIRKQIPDMAYLEMEKIVSGLLENDLRNPESFVYQLMFEPNFRRNAIESLNGVYGCWDSEKLHILNDPNVKGNDRRRLLQGAGTAFFVGVDQKGRRIPLELVQDSDNLKLSGVDDSGNRVEVPFNPEAVISSLREGKILPSIFTSYAELAFAHGFKCYGGFMQTDYLTNMRQGLVKALQDLGKHEWASKIASVPTENYTAGMTFVVAKYEDQTIQPTGGMEIMSKGGLTNDDISRIRSLRVTDANLLGLPGMYPAVFRENERDSNFQDITPETIYKMLGPKLVEIAL